MTATKDHLTTITTSKLIVVKDPCILPQVDRDLVRYRYPEEALIETIDGPILLDRDRGMVADEVDLDQDRHPETKENMEIDQVIVVLKIMIIFK